MADELSERRKRKRPSVLCQGKSRQTGKPCQQPPTPGSNLCRWHGGRLNKTRDKYARDQVTAKVQRLMPAPEHWRHLDPLEAADQYRAEADAWLAVCRDMVNQLESFEVTVKLNLDDGKTIEKVGAEVRAVVQVYEHALDRCFAMAATALKLNIQERYVDQLERHAALFARVLAVGAQMLAIDAGIPVERFAAVVPAAIETVRQEAGA